jgi:DNA-binding transcriptional MerR regulator
MRIGEFAREVGVSADTIRFYEREGLLPVPPRRDNGYREYAVSDVATLRLLIDLRGLDLPLADAARMATWCQAGHCTETTKDLPSLLAAKRRDVRDRIERLEATERRLERLEQHLTSTARTLPVLGQSGPCCDAAAAITGSADTP